MSYTKADSKITFAYTIEDLFTQAQLRTAYRARGIKDAQGVSQLDEFAISEDERDAFKVHLADAIDPVLKRIRKASVSGSNFFTDDDTTLEFVIRDHNAYNENSVRYVDRKIKDLLLVGTIKNWYKMIGFEPEVQRYTIEVLDAEMELNNSLFQLRKALLA